MNQSNILTYVCPKCLRYLSIKLDGSSVVKAPGETYLNSKDGDFNILVHPTVRCKKCKSIAIKINIIGLPCFEIISREYGIEISDIRIGEIYDSTDSTNGEIYESKLYSYPSILFKNTSDNFTHLINAITSVYCKNKYPWIRIEIDNDFVLISYPISSNITDNVDAIEYKIAEINNNFIKFITEVIQELHKLTNKNSEVITNE